MAQSFTPSETAALATWPRDRAKRTRGTVKFNASDEYDRRLTVETADKLEIAAGMLDRLAAELARAQAPRELEDAPA